MSYLGDFCNLVRIEWTGSISSLNVAEDISGLLIIFGRGNLG